MGGHARLAESARVALASLLARPSADQLASDAASNPGTNPARRLASIGLETRREAFSAPHFEFLELEELEARVSIPDPRPTVVALDAPDPSTLRVLRQYPPALLIVIGDLGERAKNGFERTCILGPRARLFVDEQGHGLAVASDGDTLETLRRSRPKIAMGPCPTWLPHWLADPVLADHPALGFVPLEALALPWHDEALLDRRSDVFVPLGLTQADADSAEPSQLPAIVAAHALELRTGSLYPDARVLVALSRIGDLQSSERAGFDDDDTDDDETSPYMRAVWTQARRALPELGDREGMHQVLPNLLDLPADVAFLAQRALIERERRRGLHFDPDSELDILDTPPTSRAFEVLRAAGEDLTEHESKVVLKAAGFEITRQAVANSASGAAQFADRIGYPVALKVLSPDLRRKGDVGGLVLDVANAAGARRAYGDIMANVERQAPDARIDGIVVAEMIEPGLEIQCGGVRMSNDELALHVRPIIEGRAIETTWGLGKASGQSAIALAEAAFAKLPSGRLRRQSDPTAHELAAVLLRIVSLFAETGKRLLRVDLNPLRIIDGERGHVVLDARIVQRAHLEGE